MIKHLIILTLKFVTFLNKNLKEIKKKDWFNSQGKEMKKGKKKLLLIIDENDQV